MTFCRCARNGLLLSGLDYPDSLNVVIFIGVPGEAVRPGATGVPVLGYAAKLIDGAGDGLPSGSTGRLAVQDRVRAEIAPCKYPRIVKFLDALPRTGSGKVKRFELRAHTSETVEKGMA